MTKPATEADIWGAFADLFFEDLMAMSDEELLAEATPEEIEQARADLRAAIIRAECDDGVSAPEKDAGK